MRKSTAVLYAPILVVVFLLLSSDALATSYNIYEHNGEKIKGWQPDNDNKITLNVWMGGLTEEQQEVAKLAIAQWQNFATADGDLADDNYDDGSGKPPANKDVMRKDALIDGTSGRSLSDTDIDGMKELYNGKTFEVNFVDKKDDSNFTIEMADVAAAMGGANWNKDGEIQSGSVKLPTNLGNVFDGPPAIPREWFYVTDSNGDGKITNSDKNKDGKSIDELTKEQGGSQYWTHMDFYSQVKHEVGHALGFDHSTIPEPATFGLFGLGLLGALHHFRRKQLK